MYHTKRTNNISIAAHRCVRNHIIKSKSDVYRLHYVRYATAEAKNKEFISWEYVPFRMPKGMERADLFTLLSYVRDKVCAKHDVRDTSHEGTSLFDSYIDVMGWERVPEATDVVPLFVVEGDDVQFNKGTFSKRHHRWYVAKVTDETMHEICAKYNLSELKL